MKCFIGLRRRKFVDSGIFRAKFRLYPGRKLLKSATQGLIVTLNATDQHRTLETADNSVGYSSRVGSFADSARLNSIFKHRSQKGLPFAQGLSHSVAKNWVAVVGVDGCVEKWAATRKTGTMNEVCDVLFQPVDVILDGIEVLAALAAGDRPGIVESLGSDLFLSLEVPVNAAFFQACGVHDGLDGTAFVAPLIEDYGSLGDDALASFLAFSQSG